MLINPTDGFFHYYSYSFSPGEELIKLDKKLFNTFNPLTHPNMSGKILEIANRVATAVTAPFIYLVLFSLYGLEWSLQHICSYDHPTKKNKLVQHNINIELDEPSESGAEEIFDDTKSEEESSIEEPRKEERFDKRILLDPVIKNPPFTYPTKPIQNSKHDEFTLEEMLFLISESEKKSESKVSPDPVIVKPPISIHKPIQKPKDEDLTIDEILCLFHELEKEGKSEVSADPGIVIPPTSQPSTPTQKSKEEGLTIDDELFFEEEEKSSKDSKIKESSSSTGPSDPIDSTSPTKVTDPTDPIDLTQKATPIQQLSKSQIISSPIPAIHKRIKSSRLKNLDAELQRLRDQRTLTSQLENSIEAALKKVKANQSIGENKFDEKQIKVFLGRAFEIKNALKDYYIFTHANAGPYYACSSLIKELVKVFLPQRDVHSFYFLRTPQQKTTTVSDFKQILAGAHASSVINDHVGQIRHSLVSVDGYLLNTTGGESALNFLCRNYSVLHGKTGAFENTFFNILESFIPQKASTLDSDLLYLAKKMMKVANQIKTTCGNLFVICVPKELVEDPDQTIVYRSHPYGKPCDCHTDDKEIKILQNMQQTELTDTTLCKDKSTPQYRLLAASLIPENGVYCYGMSGLDEKTKLEIKQEAAKIAAEAFALAQVDKPSRGTYLL